MEDTDFLRSVTLFVEFEPSDLADLRKSVLTTRYGAGDVILAEGSANRALHILRSGRVRVTQKVPNHEVALCDLASGQTFGEMSIIEDGVATATLSALTDAEIWSLSIDALAAFLREKPSAASKFWRQIAVDLRRRLVQTNEVVLNYYEANRMLAENPTFRAAYAMCNR
jgi:CRP-like cAMP-binding protein